MYPGTLLSAGVPHLAKFAAEFQSAIVACKDFTAALESKVVTVAINEVGPSGYTLLQAAIIADHGDRVANYLGAGADFRPTAASQWHSPLVLAVLRGSVDAIDALVTAGKRAAEARSIGQPISRENDVLSGFYSWGEGQIAPARESIIGIRALADHPDLQECDYLRILWPRIAGAAGRSQMLDEYISRVEERSIKFVLSTSWAGAEAFGNLNVCELVYNRIGAAAMARDTGCAAAWHGHVHVLDWLLSKDMLPALYSDPLVFGEEKAHFAAKMWRSAGLGGHVASADWLINHGVPLHEVACNRAARSGHLQLLKVLRRYGCPWSEATAAEAAGANQLQVLKWLRASGCPWNSTTASAAARMSARHGCGMLEWCLDHGAPIDDNRNICTEVVDSFGGSIEVYRRIADGLAALIARGHTCDGSTLSAISKRNAGRDRSPALMVVASELVRTCLENGALPTSEHVLETVLRGKCAAIEMLMRHDPSLVTPAQALHSLLTTVVLYDAHRASSAARSSASCASGPACASNCL